MKQVIFNETVSLLHSGDMLLVHTSILDTIPQLPPSDLTATVKAIDRIGSFGYVVTLNISGHEYRTVKLDVRDRLTLLRSKGKERLWVKVENFQRGDYIDLGCLVTQVKINAKKTKVEIWYLNGLEREERVATYDYGTEVHWYPNGGKAS